MPRNIRAWLFFLVMDGFALIVFIGLALLSVWHPMNLAAWLISIWVGFPVLAGLAALCRKVATGAWLNTMGVYSECYMLLPAWPVLVLPILAIVWEEM